MQRILRFTGCLLLAIAAVSLIGALVGMVYLGHTHPEVELHLGDSMGTLSDIDAVHWLIGAGAIAVALFVVLTVVPLSLAIAALAVAGALITVVLVLALMATMALSPVLLLLVLAWWIARASRARAAAA